MVKIKKGDTVLTVTHGAYKNYYKHLGYEPVGVAQTAENPGEENTHLTDDSQHPGDPTQLKDDDTTADETDDEEVSEDEVGDEPELSEIPLSEMSFDQLCEYADELELDHDGIRSKKEMRALIREHLK